MNFKRSTRLWLYSTGLAIIGVLVAYGFLSGEHAAAWAALLAPLFGVAIDNLPGKGNDDNITID